MNENEVMTNEVEVVEEENTKGGMALLTAAVAVTGLAIYGGYKLGNKVANAVASRVADIKAKKNCESEVIETEESTEVDE